eukprot:TRINITY_DN1827_c0_g1_i1.p1 TRINITY_DN1827_c0_g1~~TRINITY_DN1827_c0_g1_i1.p1  ORF type:complete len:531 (-),score=190.42 TRINITY_DN1827_c0_g1_i1:39-1631(-)
MLDGKVTRVVKAKRAEIEKLHEKTFRRWVNAQLRGSGEQIVNLFDDFKDGVAFVHLAEALTKKKVHRKFHATPKSDIHRLENITIAIEHFEKDNMKLGLSSQDVLEGHTKSVLGTVWRLILLYGIAAHQDHDDDLSQGKKSRAAKKKLLDWLKAQTTGYDGVSIEDFDKSWYNGLGFCALLHKYDSSLVDFESLSAENAKENLEKAFQIAEEKLGIPQLMDADDIVQDDEDLIPDSQCFMTYLAEFPIAFLGKKDEQIKDLEEEQKKAAEEAQRKALEEEKKKKEEELRLAEEERKKAEAEALKAEQERLKTEADLKRAEEERQKAADAEEARRREAEEAEARRKEEERARKEAEEKAKRAAQEKEDLEAEEERKRKEMEDLFEKERMKLEEENKKLRRELEGVKGQLIGRLKVVVEEARGLKKVDLIHKADPYCMLFLERQKEKTSVKKRTLSPKWGSVFEFYVSEEDATLECSIFDSNRFLRDIFMGSAKIPVASLNDGEEKREWFPVSGKKGVTGEILLSVTYRKDK